MGKRKAKAAPLASTPVAERTQGPAPASAPDTVELGTCQLGDVVRVGTVVGYVAWTMPGLDGQGPRAVFVGVVEPTDGPPQSWSRNASLGHVEFAGAQRAEVLFPQRQRAYDAARFGRAEVEDPLGGGAGGG